MTWNVRMALQNFNADYYRRNRQIGDRPALWFYARLVRRLLAPGPVLDFGCGPGFLLRRLQPFLPISGFEVSSYCRNRMNDELPGITVYSDLESLPCEKFAGVVALHVFEHIQDQDLVRTLAGLRYSLRPNGRMLCVMPDAGGRGRQLKGDGWSGFRDPTHINLKTASEWQPFFVHCGFRVLNTGTDGLWDFPYGKRGPVWLDHCRYSWGTVLQFLLGRLVLSAGSGESIILLLQRDA